MCKHGPHNGGYKVRHTVWSCKMLIVSGPWKVEDLYCNPQSSLWKHNVEDKNTLEKTKVEL